MDFTFKLSTKQFLLLLLMVVPATAYTNINASLSNSGKSTAANEVIYDHASTWITQDGLHHNTSALINAINDADAHGLNPASYHITSLEQAVESFVKKSEKSGAYITAANEVHKLRLDGQLQAAFVHLASDLGKGVINAQATQANLYRPAPVVNTDTLIQRLHSGESTIDVLLAELTPSVPQYHDLVAHMRSLLKQRDSGVQRTKVSLFEAVQKDTNHDSVIDLRIRLKETGDLDPDTPLTSYFSRDITKALMDVQKREGLTATGELNESTVVALNASIDKDIEQVAMNLERWRWMPRELGERHILVNIPSYKLTMMNGNQRIVNMDVVVGSEKHKTPVFSKGARIIEVAPTWTVPASITNNEIIPLELKNPGYIESERMDYFRWEGYKLVSVPRSDITPEDFLEKPFPYVLRQRAGKDNVLGQVKILMPNKHAIYLHDTQAKDLFAKTDRAFSHGCIRLSNPFLLSSLLLQLDGMSADEAGLFLDNKETTRIKMNTETPTHMTYITAWIGSDGKLHKSKDIYRYNKKLVTALHAEQTLLSTLNTRTATVLAEQDDIYQ